MEGSPLFWTNGSEDLGQRWPARRRVSRKQSGGFSRVPLSTVRPVRQRKLQRFWSLRALINENDQADRAISTGKLHTLLRFHTRPINVVVFHGSDREYSF